MTIVDGRDKPGHDRTTLCHNLHLAGRYEKKREAPYFTPSFFCRLDDEVVYWKMSFLSG